MNSNNKKSSDLYRQKLIEAMVFFAKSVKHPTKTMMYKLLAELDFRHFEQTGLPVTNLDYQAWKKGPVPKKLHSEITKGDDLVLPEDIAEALACDKAEDITDDGKKIRKFTFIARRVPNLKLFSPRQQKILKEVAEIYKNVSATVASKASHEPDKPWSKAVKRMGKEDVPITYRDVASTKTPVTEEEAEEMVQEILAFQHTYCG
ncbi:MAG: SocA family protein [Bacteroidetes bacterium]|nr:SocA family protein [Bacteroidota bacterium]MBU1422083.1 SocA family protein [Bacteroidota bacterium]MBU2635761.1 SocA family protein [Bacteroidota bacterium]